MPRTRSRPSVVVFDVEGRDQFPIDMLRYDLCYPKSELDSGVMLKSFRRGERGPHHVTLVSIKAPTVGRWESFGWKVTTVIQ